jgi:hypothetical protein
MRRTFVLGMVGLTIVTMMLAFSTDGMAGSFKEISTVGLANGGTRSAHSSPFNVSSAMQIEVFEFVTNAQDGWRCCINANTTGQDLFVRLFGLTGVQLASFQTAVNGTGCTPFVGLGSGFAFQCTVATGAGSPVNAGAHYVIGVQR